MNCLSFVECLLVGGDRRGDGDLGLEFGCWFYDSWVCLLGVFGNGDCDV